MASVQDIGIDLGTASVVIYGKGRGVVLNEPAVVAMERESRTILAVGEEARRMMGRTPGNIVAMRPLGDGMIADHEMAGAMLRYFVNKIVGKRLIGGPRVVVSLPSVVNDNDQHTISASLFDAGARSTHYIDHNVAAALGAGLPIGEAYGQMICDIGGGATELAVLSLGKVVVRDMAKSYGDLFDDAIIRFIRRKHNLLIGQVTAEDLKINIGSAIPRNEQFYMEVTGRNLLTGLPKVMRITSDDITEALEEPIHTLMEAIQAMLEHTPAELVADIFESGITLSGGGAQLSGLCEAVSLAMNLDCHLAEDPQECVARGCGVIVENWNDTRKFLGVQKRRG